MRTLRVLSWVAVLLALAASVAFYPLVPERVASHWNAAGEVDGYSSRLAGLFLAPLLMTVLGVLFLAIPEIDPLRSNIARFRPYYDRLVLVFMAFMLLVHLQILLWNAGVHISPNRLLPVALGVLFFIIGDLLRFAKRNYFVGIRTPWTLSSDVVWEDTHRLGGRLFQAAGVLSAVGVFFPPYAWVFVLAPVLLVAVVLVVYSYFDFRKQMRGSWPRN